MNGGQNTFRGAIFKWKQLALLQKSGVDPNKYSQWTKFLSLSSQLIVLLGFSVWGGVKLDEKLHLSPLLTVALPLLALVATFYKLIKETGKRNKEDGNKK